MSEKSDLHLELYSVKNYSLANKEFFTNNGQLFISKTKLCNELENDNSYHLINIIHILMKEIRKYLLLNSLNT